MSTPCKGGNVFILYRFDCLSATKITQKVLEFLTDEYILTFS